MDGGPRLSIKLYWVRIGVVLIFETCPYYSILKKIGLYCTNNIVEYEACTLRLKMDIGINIEKVLVI